MATTSLYKGKDELTMAQYEALPTIDPDTDYNVTDFPDGGITNSQMAYALTCARLFGDGSTFTCTDDGTYIQGHTYKISVENNVKSWVDITPSSGAVDTDNVTTHINNDNKLETIGVYDETNDVVLTAEDLYNAMTIERGV